MRILFLALFSVVSLLGQIGPDFTLSNSPPSVPWTSFFYRDGSSNLEYTCTALSIQPTYTWRRSDATLTSIAVSTNTATATFSSAHGLSAGNRFVVGGATVDTDLNGSYIVTSVGSTTVVFTTASVADATYTESTLYLYTNAPQLNQLVWSIKKLFYTSTNIDRAAWAEGDTSTTKRCSTRTTYAFN